MIEQKISANHPNLQYMGRIDFDNPCAPVFVFPCTYVKLRFIGTFCKANVTNIRDCWDNYAGVLVDGVQKKLKLPQQGSCTLLLAEGLPECEHEILLFKRQDSCHLLQFEGFSVDQDAQILRTEPLPERRIEVYGDSVSAGEVSEAVYYEGLQDPEHQGEFSNSYFSYAWMTARKCHAQIHNIAQGGIALLDGTGYFGYPSYKGMLSAYDKIEYAGHICAVKQWDFSLYTPDVVIVAIGQNDNHPLDYMENSYNCEKAKKWRDKYKGFIEILRGVYPRTTIILSTTILGHHPNWDRSIHQVWEELEDDKIHHFLYSNNGCGTRGHIRIQEAEQMAGELSAYINKLGVWR